MIAQKNNASRNPAGYASAKVAFNVQAAIL